MIRATKRVKRRLAGWSRSQRAAISQNTPDWARKWFGPALMRADMLFLDHGIFRTIYLNCHQIDDLAFRAAQPTPGQIHRLAERGIKTIVNLRGERDCGSYWLERDACAKADIELVNYQVRSRAAPTVGEILGSAEIFERIEYPILMHCKSGADRAGLMSTLYLILQRGVPAEQAVRQLSLRYGHIRQAKTGILDHFFERYIADNQEQPIDFLTWVTSVYDPRDLVDSFVSNSFADRIVDSVLNRE